MPSDMPHEMLMDIRIYERNARKGLITEKEIAKRIEGLPDLEDHTVVIEAKVEHTAEIPGGRVASITAARQKEEDID